MLSDVLLRSIIGFAELCSRPHTQRARERERKDVSQSWNQANSLKVSETVIDEAFEQMSSPLKIFWGGSFVWEEITG